MNRRAGIAALFLALAAACLLASSARAVRPISSARDLITREIDDDRRVVLSGNTRPEVRFAHDRGPVPDEFPLEHMLLQLRRPPELQQAYDGYVESLSQGQSANFHQWLTPEQVGDQYGLSTADLRQIEMWLRQRGFHVNYIYPSKVVMDISGTARQMREAFHVQIHYLDVNGVRHFANMNDPEIPEALAPAIVGIVAIHDFKPRSMMHKPVRPLYTDPEGDELLGPADLAQIYNFNPVFNAGITGFGQLVVLIEDSDPYNAPSGTVNPADWVTFENEFKLGGYGGSVTVTNPNIPGNCPDPGWNGDDTEVSLDMEYARAAAPGSSVVIAACSNLFIAIENVVNEPGHPFIMSVSYGECEPALGAAANSAITSIFQMAASEGMSVFVSSGDQSAASCDASDPHEAQPPPGSKHGISVSGLATTAYNVAVGGTDFGDTFAGTNNLYWSATNSGTLQSAMSYIPEIPWNSSCASVLVGLYVGVTPPYGASGACAAFAGSGLQTIAGGSGGPSGCATGAPSTAYQVSGTCAGYLKPAWQSLVGNPNDGVRDIPDVSLFAANGLWGHYYVYCDSDPTYGNTCAGTPNPAAGGPWSGAGGTSFASPIMAGIQALIDQRTHALMISPTPGQGNPNPIYYAIAASEYGAAGSALCNSSAQPITRRGVDTTCVFYDITQGDNNVNCLVGSANCYDTDATPSNVNGALSTGSISGLTFTAGSGYTSAPACSISAPHNTSAYNGFGGGVQATCTATAGGGHVTGVTLTLAGSGYAPLPICKLTGGGGMNATCSVTGITNTDYEPAFPTTPGWDFATGIGTINVYNLVMNSMWQTGT